MPLTINFDLSSKIRYGEQKDLPNTGRLNLMPKKLRLTTHEKSFFAAILLLIFSFDPYPQMAKENPLVSASSEALR